MARRLITTLLTVVFALALATAALAANDESPPPPSNEVPESRMADRMIAAIDGAEASLQRASDALLRRLDRIASSSAANTESLRVVAVQKPDDTVPNTTDTGGDGPGPTAAPTTNTGTTTTTTAPPGGPTSTTGTTTTTTRTAPPTCNEPDEQAIQDARDLLELDILAAATVSDEDRAALREQAVEDEAALEAALGAARTVEDVNRAYADAVTRLNANYDGLIAAIEKYKNSITIAGERAAAHLRQACDDEDDVRNVLKGIADELERWDRTIEAAGTSHADGLAALDAEKAAFLKDFVPAGDDNGGGTGGENGNGDGNGNGGENGSGSGNGGQEDGGGSLPFAGASALPLLIAGLILVGAGVATVVVTRRRRDGESTN